VQAILRRVELTPTEGRTLRVAGGRVELELDARLVRDGGEAVHLTATEFDLVSRLAQAKGAVLSREQLLSDVWGYRDGSGIRTVDSHVRSVRRKLGDDVIRTVHTVGYAIGTDR
jgi:DNA-binding response OmpR family regulator